MLFTLMAETLSNSSSLTSNKGRVRCVQPALLTITSSRPLRRRASSIRASTWAERVMSAWKKLAVPPAAVMSATTRWPLAASMSLTMTLPPSAARRLAMPSPMPLPAPVTMMDWFCTRMEVSLGLSGFAGGKRCRALCCRRCSPCAATAVERREELLHAAAVEVPPDALAQAARGLLAIVSGAACAADTACAAGGMAQHRGVAGFAAVQFTFAFDAPQAIAAFMALVGRARRICGKRRDGVAQGHGDRGALSGALSWGVQGGAGRRAGSSSVSDGHGFERGKAVQRLEAFFTPVAAGFDAAER